MAHLLGVRRVVQHDQHPPSDEQRPVQRGPFVEPERDVGGGESQREQDPGERLGGFQGRQMPVVPAQRHEELPVGEGVPGPLRPPQGQRRLAGPGHAADHREVAALRRRDRQRGAARGQQRVQLAQFALPADEAPGGLGHAQLLMRPRRDGARGPAVRRADRVQQPLTRRAQGLAGAGRQLPVQPGPGRLVRVQRRRRVPAVAVGPHQTERQLLVVRPLLGQRLQLREDLLGSAEPQLRVEVVQQHGAPLAVQGRAQRLHAGAPQIAECDARPLRQRGPQQPAALLVVPDAGGPARQIAEPAQVHGRRVHPQHVSAVLGRQDRPPG